MIKYSETVYGRPWAFNTRGREVKWKGIKVVLGNKEHGKIGVLGFI